MVLFLNYLGGEVMKKFLKNNICEIFSFFITIIILLFIFKCVGILDNSIIISDLLQEFYPMFKHLILFYTGKVGLYSFNLGLGDSFLGTFFFYMSSPFNLLLLLIRNVNIFCIITIILRAALASVFCCKYLKYQSSIENKLYIFIFSIMYPLSSFYLSYNMHVEFLDIYMLFPLVLLGVDKIIKENKYLLYVLSLAMTIFCNYYFAYMVCIFSFIYFNYHLLFNKIKLKELLKKNGLFIVITFIVCLTLSFIFLPVISEIGSYSRNNTMLFGGESFKVLFNLRDIVNHYIIGNFVDIDIINSNKFYIYTSIIVIPLIYFYFINEKIDKREKILSSVVFIILFISIGFNYANYMWHGFVPTRLINGRFTFMFILFIINICFKSTCSIEKFAFKYYLICFSLILFSVSLYSIIYYPRFIDVYIILRLSFGYLFIVLSALFIKKYKINNLYYLSLTITFLIILFILYLLKMLNISTTFVLIMIPISIFLMYFLIRERNFKIKHFILMLFILYGIIGVYSIFSNLKILGVISIIKILMVLLFIILLRYIKNNKVCRFTLIGILFIEILINNYNYLNRFFYTIRYDESYDNVIQYIKNNDNSKFYRIDDNQVNNSILYNFNGVDYFVSTIKSDLINFFINMNAYDLNDGKNCLNYDGSYNLLSSLLGIKYYISEDEIANYNKINNIFGYNIYKNNESLEFGYMVNSKIEKLDLSDNGLENINSIYKTMTNNDKNIVDSILLKKNSINNYKFINSSDRDIYILIDFNDDVDFIDLDVYLNNELITCYKGTYLFKIKNNYDLDSEIVLSFNYDNISNIDNYISGVYAYYYNEDVYIEDINILKKSQFKVSDIGKSKLKGNIEVTDNGILFLSCLYNKNLDVYVDGKKKNSIKLLDTFMGFELTPGKHEIEIVYKSNMLYISLISSSVGLLLLLVFLLKNYSYNLKK